MGNRVSRKLSEKRSKKKEQQKRASYIATTNNPSPKPSKRQPQISEDKIQRIFERYADNNDTIGPEGVMQFCEDLCVDPEDISVLVLAWHFNAKTMCYFSRDEFLNGMKNLCCDSIVKLKEKMKTFPKDLNNPHTFRDIYHFVFLWSRETADARTLDIETAVEMLELLFASEDIPFIVPFCNFLQTQREYKAINKDQWNSLLDFCVTSKTDLTDYDETGSWPLMLDEFVTFARAEYPEDFPAQPEPVDTF